MSHSLLYNENHPVSDNLLGLPRCRSFQSKVLLLLCLDPYLYWHPSYRWQQLNGLKQSSIEYDTTINSVKVAYAIEFRDFHLTFRFTTRTICGFLEDIRTRDKIGHLQN